MSMCVILFDSDGCTAIYQSAKVDFSARKGGQYHLPYRGKKHLVEVLEMNDNEKTLDDFDKAWWASARGSLVLARKGLVQKEGGFLSCVPVNETMLPVVKLRRKTSEGKKIEANGDSQKKKPGRALRKVVSRCAKSISTKIRSLPLLPSRKTSKKVKSTGQKVVNAVVKNASKRKADVEVTAPNKKKKMGTKGRTITVEYEGGMEQGNTIAQPRREPVFLEHLDTDQRETVEAEINFYKKKLISTSTQTEPCVVLDCDDEARDFERNKKWLEVLSTVKEIHKAILLPPTPGIEATSQDSISATPANISLEIQDETLNVSCNTNTTVDLPSPTLTPVVQPWNRDSNSSSQRSGPSPNLNRNTTAPVASPTLTPNLQHLDRDSNSSSQRPGPSPNLNRNAAVDTASPILTSILQPWDRDSNSSIQKPGPSPNLNRNAAVDTASPILTPILQLWDRDSNSSIQKPGPSPNLNRKATVPAASPTLTPILQPWDRDSNSSSQRPGPSPNLNRNAAVDTASPTLTPILQPWDRDSNSSSQRSGPSPNLNRNAAVPAASPTLTPILQPWDRDSNSSSQKPGPSPNLNRNATVPAASPTLTPILQPWDRDSNSSSQKPGPSPNLNRNATVPAASPTLIPILQPWDRDSNSSSQRPGPSPNLNRNAAVDTASPTLTPILQPWNRDSNSSSQRPGPSPNLNRNATVPAASPTLTPILQPWNRDNNFSSQRPDPSTNLNRSATVPAASPLFQMHTEDTWEAVGDESWNQVPHNQNSRTNATMSNPYMQTPNFERAPCTISSQSQNESGFLDHLLSEEKPTVSYRPHYSGPEVYSATHMPVRNISSTSVSRQPFNEITSNPVEIKSFEDMIGVQPNMNIELNRQTKHNLLMKYGYSVTMFSWKLVQTIYSEEELYNRNFYGRGRPCLSPRRRKVVVDTLNEYFHSHTDRVRQGVDAVNSGIRALRRKRLSTLSDSL